MADKKKITSAPPSLVGKRFYLRPANPDDIKKCYHWVIMAEPQSYNPEPAPILSAGEASEQFKSQMHSTDSQSFMIVMKESDTPVGVIKYEHLNSLNRSAELAWYFDPEEQADLKPTDGIAVLIDYLFAYRNLNKVIAFVREGDKERVKLVERLGFKKDGTLRQHHFFDNKYHDLLLYSLLRFEYGGRED
jgi:RimJ/RimL family protein N-acetyltransferase